MPIPGVLAQTQRFTELGLRYRLYLFEGQEHYGPPIQDEWTEGAAFEHRDVRDRNPSQCHLQPQHGARARGQHRQQRETGRLGLPLRPRLRDASGLQPVDRKAGVASFDGRTLARPEAPHTLFVPEVGGPTSAGQTGPVPTTGQAWKTDEAARPKARNGFAITVTGTRAVTLHLRRRAINPRRRGFGKVTTDGRLRLRLVGHGKLRKVVVPPGEHRIVY